MAREQILSDKRRQRILDRMPEVTTSSMVEEEDAELEESFDEKRRSRAPKRVDVEPANVASISDTGDLRAVDYLNLPEPTIEDPRSMSDSDRRLRQQQIAAEAPSHPWYKDEDQFTEKIQRGMDLDDIRGEEDSETGIRESAVGEDARQYAKQYSRIASENPGMAETELQDAAIKAVKDIQAEKAAYYASKFDDVDYGEEMEDAALAQMRREQAEAAAKEEQDRVATNAAKIVQDGGSDSGGDRPTPADAAKKAIASLQSMSSDELADRLKPVEITSTDLGESESSTDLEFEPGESEVTKQEVEDVAVEREYAARPTQSGVSRVAPQSQEEKAEYARYKPEVKQVAEARIVKPATEALDDIYLTPDNQEATAKNLDKFLTKTRSGAYRGYSILGGAAQSALDSLTARNEGQYYKTLPLFMKRNLDREALKAIEFFDEFNRKRGQPSVGKGFFELLLSPRQKAGREYQFLEHIARARRVLQNRLKNNEYEQSTELPGTFAKGDYLPTTDLFGLTGYEKKMPVYSEEVPLEAQEDVYQESDPAIESIIATIVAKEEQG